LTRLRLGACLSLTGRYGRFGRQAAHGLRVWQQLAGDEVELEIEDDGSDPEAFAVRFRRVASRCDVLLGPYSTQLMREAGEAMSEVDGLLWNQGGSGDDVQALCPGRIISLLAPTTRYAVPFVRTRAGERERAPLWVVRGRGRFGRRVAAGAVEQARRDELETVEKRTGDGPLFDDVREVWDLFSVGRFEDDLAIVNEARSAPHPPRAICSVAAGVQDFASEVEDVDGIYGIAQWYPGRGAQPELGPAEDDFVDAYRELAQAQPDYPAVQAAAGAVLATRCVELAGSTEPDALWAIAAELDTTTLLGEFKIDASTGAQTKHTTVLLRWRGDELQLAA
jgi:ABC-type branched-subunit amino acid transport system substrate-binding protein